MILVTGGTGYIGSHTVLALLESGYEVVVLDNLSNSSRQSLARVEKICGKSPRFVEGDILDATALDTIFSRFPIKAVIHFAGLKAVGESVEKPLMYYRNNVAGTLTLCEAMARANVFDLVFSSSATVYGEAEKMPLRETDPTGRPTNPYGRSKLMIEELLQDLAVSDERWRIGLLRYFNPVGAHLSGLIGEDPGGIPNNLLPYVAQVAVGVREELSIFGNDYDTPDGTGVRDYIHVMDLAEGHLAALQYLCDTMGGVYTWNLGAGQGYSVLEIIGAFERASGKKIPYTIVDRRPGDVAVCYSDPSRAANELGWRAKRTLDEMMSDTWRWQLQNPHGYEHEIAT